MKYFTTLLLALALVSVSGLGTADPVTRTQTASGSILLGHPGTLALGANEFVGPSDLDGIDGAWIALDVTATGIEQVDLTFSSASLAAGLEDLDVIFYDADFGYLSQPDCLTDNAGYESCLAPAGAAFAVVNGFTGVQVDYTLTYTYAVDLPA